MKEKRCIECGKKLTPKTVNGWIASFTNKDIGKHTICLQCRKEGVCYW